MREIPPGFEIVRQTSARDFEIIYRSRGMGCAVFFCLAVPSMIIIIWLLVAVASPDPHPFREFFSSWWVIIMIGGAVAFFHMIHWGLFQLYGSIRFIGSPDTLMVERELFGYHSKVRIPVESFKHLQQTKDGGGGENGRGDDSFPSWELTLVGKRRRILLSRQPIEMSQWLGEMLAAAYGLPFIPSTKRE